MLVASDPGTVTLQHTLALTLSLSVLAPGAAFAQTFPATDTSPGGSIGASTEAPPEATPLAAHQRLVAIGVRFSGRAGDYLEGGLGGQLRLQVHPWIAIELFTDQFAGTMNGSFRHDHEIGGTFQVNVLRGRRGEIFPFVGACASLAVLDAPQGGASATDIRAGARAGVGGMLDIGHGFALEALLEAVTYIGHPLQAYSWTAMTGPNLAAEAVGQLTVAVNYAF